MIVDFHSHILPGIDDGSADLAESLALLGREAAQGIDHVVATPHFYARYDQPEAFFRRRDRAEAQLRQALAGRAGLPQLSVGAEVHFFRGISQSEVADRLTIDGTAYLMVEMPQGRWTEAMYRELEDLHRRGLRPILAHIDRYLSPFHSRDILRRLEQLPVVVQANADFFLGRRQRLALAMLRREQIHLLGSDCHNLHARPPRLGAALAVIEKKLGPEALLTIQAQQEHILGR